MAFTTKLNLTNAKFEQTDGSQLNLSGDTRIAATGTIAYLTDQSGGFTNRSLVDKSYVTGQTANLDAGIAYISGVTDSNYSQLTGFSASTYTMYEDVGDPTGFVDNESIVVSYNSTNRTITLSAATGNIEYYYKGVKHTLTNPWTSDAHDNTTEAWFLYSTDGETFEWSTAVWNYDDVQVAVRPANTSWAIREIHGLMPWETHQELHRTIGTYRVSGFGLTDGTYEIQPASPVNADNTPGFEAGTIADEDLQTSLNAWTQDSYSRLFFTGGAGTANFQTAQSTIFRIGTTYPTINTWNGTTFNEDESSHNKYFNYYVIRIPVTADAGSQLYRAVILQPQFEYDSLAAAQAENPLSINLGTFANLAPEYVLVERITLHTNSGYTTTGKVRIEAVSILTGAKFNQTSTTPGAGTVTAGNVSVTPLAPFTDTNMQTLSDAYATCLTALDEITDVAITGVTNGLTKVGAHSAKLGGSLTEATTITILNTTSLTVTDSRTTPLGIQYGGDYSANYTNRSLVDKEYVDNSSGSIGATNGLTRIGDNITLGGALTGTTTVCGVSNLLEFTNDGSDKLYVNPSGVFMCSCVSAACNATVSTESTGRLRFIQQSGGVQMNVYANNGGLYYDSNYSSFSGFTARSLVDKGYVTGLTSISVTTANNGLTKTGQKVKLGGSITGTTTLAVASTGALNVSDARSTTCGIVYSADYRAGFQPNSLVSKCYVDTCDVAASGLSLTYANDYTDACVAACTITANNGLTKSGNNIRLGGALTGNTSITGAHTLGTNVTILNLTGVSTNIGGTTYLKTAPAGSGGLLCINSSTGEICQTSLGAFGGLTGATNGIGTTGQNVCLGAALTAPTTICGSSKLTLGKLAGIEVVSSGSSNCIHMESQGNGSLILKATCCTGAAGNDFTDAVGMVFDYNASCGMMICNGTASPKGIVYADDYSTTYVDRSLVDKAYVDSVATGLEAHAAVCVATTANITYPFSTLLTIDGVTLSNGDRVLVKNQTTGWQNGIWSASTGTWGRTSDYNFMPSGEVASGDLIPVLSGNTNANSIWILVTPDPISSGDTLTFSQFSRLLDVTAGDGIDVTTVGNSRQVAVKLASTNPGLEFSSTELRLDYDIFRKGLCSNAGFVDVRATTGGATGTEIGVRIDTGGTNVLYVDSDDIATAIGTPITTAENGLTKTGTKVKLGGSITGATTLGVATTGSLVVTDGRATPVGVQYSTDYSSTFAPRSLVDKGYVTGLTSALQAITDVVVTGATNGICKDGAHDVKLGGSISESTLIDLESGNFFRIGCNTGNDIADLSGGTIHISNCSSPLQEYVQLAYYNRDFDTRSKVSLWGCGDVIELWSASGSTSKAVCFTPYGAMEYGADYSADYTNRSLVDKEYVDDMIAASGASATNGLNRNSAGAIGLGGTLTGDTLIDGAGYDFTLTGATYTTIVGSPFGSTICLNQGDTCISMNSSVGGTITFGASISGGTFLRNSGFSYLNDLSSLNTENPRWIPDKEYVDTVIGSLTYLNGLTKSGNDVKLGGTLCENTGISTDITHYFNVTTGGGMTDTGLHVCSDGTVIIGENSGSNDKNIVFNPTVGICLFGYNTDVNIYTAGASPTTNGGDVSIQSSICKILLGTAIGNLTIDGSGAVVWTDDRTSSEAGIEYADCYHNTYTDRSLVDKEYVDNAVGGISANNGLSRRGDNIVLGGLLTGDTVINLGFVDCFEISNNGSNGLYLSRGDSLLGYTGNSFIRVGNADSCWQTFGGVGIYMCHNICQSSCIIVDAASVYTEWDSSNNAVSTKTLSGCAGIIVNDVDGGNVVLSAKTASICLNGNDNTVYISGVASLVTTPAAGSTSDSVLVRDSGTGEVKTVTGSALGDKNNIYATTVVTSSTGLTTGSSYTILANHTAAITITLPSTPLDGQVFKIKDASGNALTNNITISGNGNNIDGGANALINTDYGALELVYNSSLGEWFGLAFVN